jgi:hypothetical protein
MELTSNNEYLVLLQKTTELAIRVSSFDNSLQNNAIQTNQAIVNLRDELIRTNTELKGLVTNLSNTLAHTREVTEMQIARAIEENNKLLTEKFATSDELSLLSTKIDRLSTKIGVVGGSITIVAVCLAWLLEHPQLLQIFK